MERELRNICLVIAFILACILMLSNLRQARTDRRLDAIEKRLGTVESAR